MNSKGIPANRAERQVIKRLEMSRMKMEKSYHRFQLTRRELCVFWCCADAKTKTHHFGTELRFSFVRLNILNISLGRANVGSSLNQDQVDSEHFPPTNFIPKEKFKRKLTCKKSARKISQIFEERRFWNLSSYIIVLALHSCNFPSASFKDWGWGFRPNSSAEN